jgi:hypothetical protein
VGVRTWVCESEMGGLCCGRGGRADESVRSVVYQRVLIEMFRNAVLDESPRTSQGMMGVKVCLVFSRGGVVCKERRERKRERKGGRKKRDSLENRRHPTRS